MSEHTPRTEIDLGTIALPESPQMGCRLCHTESHTAYVLCPNHSPAHLEAINTDLLAALKQLCEWIETRPAGIHFAHQSGYLDAQAAIAKAELPA